MVKNFDLRKFIHLTSTIWLVLTFFYVFINALRYWGLRWWVIFSLSGYSLLIVLLLVSFYLFAIYNGLVRYKKNEEEHPLTTTNYYMFLYDLTPFIGTLAAAFAVTNADNISQSVTVLAIGTFVVTFIFWIIIDPSLNLIETSLPKSRIYRKQRLIAEKAQKLLHKQKQKVLLSTLQENERKLRQTWDIQLSPMAQQLSKDMENLSRFNPNKLIDFGLKAWQYGGKECMLQLKNKTLEMLGKSHPLDQYGQLIEFHWNGIGEWNGKFEKHP